MSALQWNVSSKKLYKLGLDKPVLYVRDADTGAYTPGVAWEGLISANEKPGGAEETALYANNVKYASLMSRETLEGTLEAYSYPEEFGVCDGSAVVADGIYLRQQSRATFGLAYRTNIGSDAGGEKVGYEIHLIWGCRAKPSELPNTGINESPEATTLSWDYTTTPIDLGEDFAPASKMVIDSTKCTTAFLTWLEEQIFGKSTPTAIVPNLPLPAAIIAQADTIG